MAVTATSRPPMRRGSLTEMDTPRRGTPIMGASGPQGRCAAQPRQRPGSIPPPPMSAIVTAERLSKTFRVKVRDPGLRGALAALVRPRHRDVHAVQDGSFRIESGEIVAFLGPNGAGKTTTLKMLTVLLYPTSGQVDVAGFVPWTGGRDFKRRIALVLGNRQQLVWDLPPEETFLLNRAIYDIPEAAYRERLAELVDLLELHDVLEKPVRQLSLGERMKCELAAALLPVAEHQRDAPLEVAPPGPGDEPRDVDLPAGGVEQAREHLEGRGLAGAV